MGKIQTKLYVAIWGTAAIALFIINLALFFRSDAVLAVGGNTSPSVSLSSYTANTATNFTVTGTAVNGIPAGGLIEVITGGFWPPGFTFEDVDFLVNGTQRTLAATSSATADGVLSASPGTIQISISSASAIPTGATLEIRIGTNATHQSTGTKQITNAQTNGIKSVNLSTWINGAERSDIGYTNYTITNYIQFISGTSTSPENITSINIPIKIDAVAEQNINVNYAVTGGTATGGGNDYTLANGVATISIGTTTANISMTIVNDSVTEANETIIITLSNPVNTDLGTTSIHTFTITDNDTPAINVTQTGTTTDITEGGATDTYTIVLATVPSADVTVTPTPNSQVSVMPTSLAFTTANWSNPQTVTVSAVNDATVESAHTGTITHVSASSDTNYNNLTIVSITANITDNDSSPPQTPQSGGGGGGGGGSGGMISTPPVQIPPVPTNTNQPNEEPIVDSKNNGKKPSADSVEVLFKDLSKLDLTKKSNLETLAAVTKVIPLMITQKTYKIPSNKKFLPNYKTTVGFASQLALTINNTNCADEKITAKYCKKAARQLNLISQAVYNKKYVTRAELYEALFKAADIKLIQSSTDSSPIATAKKYGLLSASSKTKIYPEKLLSRKNAVIAAYRLLNTVDKKNKQ